MFRFRAAEKPAEEGNRRWARNRRARASTVGLLFLLATLPIVAQEEQGNDEAADPDIWEAFRVLDGAWEAEISGKLGVGVGRREYEFIFGGLYLVHRHASVRQPQEDSPEGDYHRELAVYSYDRERQITVLREFMGEGYVLQYRCDVESKRFVCVSEQVESGSGIRARLTVNIQHRNAFEELYELAFPGEELQVYFRNNWTRVPDLAD